MATPFVGGGILPHWSPEIPEFPPLKEKGGEERTFFCQSQLEIAMDGVHFHEVDGVMRYCMENVSDRWERMDWAVDIAV